jgi:hypothetical protein
MIRWLAWCLVLGAFGTAHAQETSSELDSRIGKERSKLEAMRLQSAETLDQQEAACFEKFRVNDCLSEVKRRRLAMSSDISRQEALLNDQQRQQRGAEQAQRTREKAFAREESAKSAAAVNSESEQRSLRQAAPPAPNVPALTSKAAKEPNLPSADQRANYERRQEEARSKRAERDKRVGDPGAKQLGLPVPD